MKPGVFLSVTFLTDAQAASLWEALWRTVPPQWERLPDSTALCAAIGLDPKHMVTVRTPRIEDRPVELTLILNRFQIEMTNIIAIERQYEQPISTLEQGAAIAAFLDECLKPHLGLAEGGKLEVAGFTARDPG